MSHEIVHQYGTECAECIMAYECATCGQCWDENIDPDGWDFSDFECSESAAFCHQDQERDAVYHYWLPLDRDRFECEWCGLIPDVTIDQADAAETKFQMQAFNNNKEN
jgi:hypothetical protein